MNLVAPLPRLTGLHAGLFVSRRDRGLRHPERMIGSHELILVRSGELHLHEDGEPLVVAANEALLLTAGRRHGGTADYSRDLSFHWLHFTGPDAADGVPLPRHSRPRRPDLLMQLMHRYTDDYISGSSTPATAGHLVALILAELAAAASAAPVSGRAAHLVGRAEAWIGQHYHRSISTAAIAAALGCNPDHLGRVFRLTTGSTVVEALQARRIGEAQRRLIETADDIAIIARSVGFVDLVHFRRVFRRATGTSPGAFRAAHARAFVNSD